MATEAYSSIATVKEYLSIPTASASEDTAIGAALDAAEAQIDEYCGRTFVTGAGTAAREFYPVTDKVVRVDDIGTLTGLVVKEDTGDDGTFETTRTITTDFVVIGNEVPYTQIMRVDGSSWTRPRSLRPSVEVTAVWTYDDSAVPAQVVQAATVLAARLYHRRSSPLGFQTGVSPEFGAVRISRVDPDVAGLLSGLRVLAVA